MWRIAFDIGGTFTDFVLAGPGAPPRFLKAPTTPDDPARAVLDGFEQMLADAGLGAGDLHTVLHATTGHCHINLAGRKVRWILNWPDAPALV